MLLAQLFVAAKRVGFALVRGELNDETRPSGMRRLRLHTLSGRQRGLALGRSLRL